MLKNSYFSLKVQCPMAVRGGGGGGIILNKFEIISLKLDMSI